MAVGAQALDERSRIDAVDRFLAGWVDRRHEHHVGVVEGVLELFHQRLQAGVAVRLHDRDDALLCALACCREDGADFGRVVSVIIDDDRAVRLPDMGEAAFDALETFESGNDCVVQYAELDGDGDRRQSVLNIVAPGDRHMERKRSALAVAAENDGIELAAEQARVR